MGVRLKVPDNVPHRQEDTGQVPLFETMLLLHCSSSCDVIRPTLHAMDEQEPCCSYASTAPFDRDAGSHLGILTVVLLCFAMMPVFRATWGPCYSPI